MRVLQLVTSAYRATIEEQDDTILWLTQAMRNAGAEMDVLLMGAAVNYALAGQDASGLSFGAWRQTQPPKIERDLAMLIQKGARIFAVAEDMAERGLSDCPRVDGIALVRRGRSAEMLSEYDQVWRW